MVTQSLESGAHDKKKLTITIYIEKKGKFAKINPELKYKIFLKATSPNIKNLGSYLALINRAGGLYGGILTEVVSTDRTQ